MFFFILIFQVSTIFFGVVFVSYFLHLSEGKGYFEFSASIREGRVALVSVVHPRGTHSRYVIGCCLIPLGICGLRNNSRRITYGIGCVRGMPSLSPLSSLG